MRQRSFWCLECVAEMMKVNLRWRGDSKHVVKCEKYSSLGYTTTNVYGFYKHPFGKTSGPIMSQKSIMENRNRKQMEIELVVGDWVLYDSMSVDYDDDDSIWIGRVVSKPKWGGQDVWKIIQAGG